MTTMQDDAAVLRVHELAVAVAGRPVLQGVTLALRPGQVVVLMGANGSGKSTLGLALAGHPHYQVTGGQARLGDADLLALDATARSRAGLFLSFQSPPDIPGVRNNLFLRTALNALRQHRGQAQIDAYDFLGAARAEAARVGLPEALLGRAVNEGYSGGERKRNELLQLALLQPKVAVLDEIDSGLDVDGVRAVVAMVQAQRARGTAMLVVSHYLHMIESLEPDAVLRLDAGRIADTGDIALARALAREGYRNASAAVAQAA